MKKIFNLLVFYFIFPLVFGLNSCKDDSLNSDFIQTSDVLTTVFVIDEFTSIQRMSTSNLTITIDNVVYFSHAMEEGTQAIAIPNGGESYVFTISLPGYLMENLEFEYSDLIKYENTPLKVILQPNSQADLIGFFDLDQGEAFDEVSGDSASIFGAEPTKNRHDVENKALYFDGVDDRVDLNKLYDLDSKTIVFWFNVDILSDSYKQGLFSINNNSIKFGLTAIFTEIIDDKLILFFNQGGHEAVLYSQEIEREEWYMLTIATDASGSDYYLNDELVARVNKYRITSGDGDYTARIGSGRNKTIPFHGMMDDVIIFSDKFNSEQVGRLFRTKDIQIHVPF